MKTKILSLLLCFVLVLGTLTGCNKKAEPDTSNTKTAGNSSVSADSSSGSSEEDTWKWPLDEKKELSIWIVWESNYLDDPNELKAIQQIEANTNVHVNWQVVSSTEASEKFSLMISSGEYPDIIRGAESYYSGGLSKMVSDGIAIDLTDKVDKYMPNYSALINNDPDLNKDVRTDDGRIIALYTIASDIGEVKGERVWGGPNIRKDWLDETGLGTPVTIDDWYNVLKAIKANHPECEAPMMIGATGTNIYGAFTSAFGVLPGFYNDNGTVKFGPCEEGYRQYVETMAKWYKEGLIDPNFTSNDASFMASPDYIGTGKAAAGMNIWGMTANVYATMGYNNDENYWLQAVPYPVLKEGDTPQCGFAMSEKRKETMVITSSCKDVELAMRYLDYYYTKDCMILDSYGIENDSYVVDSDGKYHISDSLKAKVEDGTYPTLADAVYTYTLGTAAFGLYNWRQFDAIYEGNPALSSYDAWEGTHYDLMLPSAMTLTEDESQEYASLYPDIQTLVQENTVKFIMGTKSMDEYDSFVEQLHSYGVDRCIELQQAALDRYNAR